MREALDGEGAEFRVFVADLPRGLIICGCAPGLNRFEAVELVDGDARTRRRPFERNDILPGGDQAAARRLDRGLDNRDILFLISKSVMSVSVTT